MQRCREEFENIDQPHARWFLEPFGYMEVRRAMQGGRRRQGTDYLRVLSNQGFRSALRGAGGWVVVKPEQGDYEFLHRSYVWAPPVPGANGQPNAEKYELAARMMQFPNGENLQVLPWVPRDVAAHLTYNWKLQEAFEYSSTLVNEVAGEPIFEDVLESLRIDDKGPKVDLRTGLVAHLGTRVTLISDYQQPITPTSERTLAAFELTNADAVAATLAKAMANDPTARKVMHGQQVLWEIVPEEDGAEDEGPVVEVGPRFGGKPRATKPKQREQPAFPNSALAVAHGCLMSASHIDFMKAVLDRAADEGPLGGARDYQRVMNELEALGAGNESFRYFARADQANYVNYELLRQGKMPQSQSLLGRALNELFAPEDESKARTQEIDARTLPNYDIVRRHLGPAGVYVKSEDNGWLVVGCALKKDLSAAEAPAAAGP
jgi:hypothetical protein